MEKLNFDIKVERMKEISISLEEYCMLQWKAGFAEGILQALELKEK